MTENSIATLIWNLPVTAHEIVFSLELFEIQMLQKCYLFPQLSPNVAQSFWSIQTMSLQSAIPQHLQYLCIFCKIEIDIRTSSLQKHHDNFYGRVYYQITCYTLDVYKTILNNNIVFIRILLTRTSFSTQTCHSVMLQAERFPYGATTFSFNMK